MEKDTKKYTFKFKPVYNFQSVEFEVEAEETDLPYLFELYGIVLKDLIATVDGVTNSKGEPVKEQKKVEKLATDRQIEIMNKFGIRYPKDVTMREAQELINESIERSKDN